MRVALPRMETVARRAPRLIRSRGCILLVVTVGNWAEERSKPLRGVLSDFGHVRTLT